MTNLDSVLKSRDITLPTNFYLFKAINFPVVMYGYESWTIKKAECPRIDAFELWCWRRLLRVPWTAKRSNQSILEEISPGCSLEGLMLKLKLQYFGHMMWNIDSFEKTLMLGKIEGGRMSWLNGVTDSMDMSLGGLRELVMDSRTGVLQSMGSERFGHDWVTELDWLCLCSWPICQNLSDIVHIMILHRWHLDRYLQMRPSSTTQLLCLHETLGMFVYVCIWESRSRRGPVRMRVHSYFFFF